MKRSEFVDRNPFAPESIEEQSTRRLSTAEERDAVSAPLAQLREDGYTIFHNLIDERTLDEIKAEFVRLHADTGVGDSEFGGYTTQRVYNLVARTRSLDPLYLHPQILALIEAHLDDQVQLSISSSVNLLPGETAQEFHRDDGYYPLPRPHIPLSMNTMWAIDDFTADNGATLLIPGTHRSGESHPRGDAKPIRATMTAGSVLVWDGSLFHAGGANQTDRPRLGVTNIYCRAWLRQQENLFVSVPPQTVLTLPRGLQKLLGYWVVNNLLGYINNASPLSFLKEQYLGEKHPGK